ncbi:MAG: undecaprenyl-diphosphate phosphatase [Streptosporangiaceae bacterium]|jgi:undecaprenyl pyrophosphate phosphatase UppP
MSHLTYAQAIVTGIVQGVTELFPISSLGHNVLIPALIGGSWAKDLSVTAKNSPYLAFIVGLHVATALAMIIYFRRDWIRIVRGFFSSVRVRRVETSDQRLAWMIILGTIPVGIVGLLLQKVFTSVFARPTLTAFFLAVNGVVLLYSERQRRRRLAVSDGQGDYGVGDDAGYADQGYGGQGYGGQGYGGEPGGGSGWDDRRGGHGRDAYGGDAYGGDAYGRDAYGGDAYGGDAYGGGPGRGGAPEPGRGRRGRPDDGYSQQPQQQQWQGPGRQDPDPRGERPQPRFQPNPGYQAPPGYGQAPSGGQQPPAGGQQPPGGGQIPGYGQQPQGPGYGQQPPAGGGAGGPAPAGGPTFTPNPGYQQQSDPRYGRDPRQNPADPRHGRGDDATEVRGQRGSRHAGRAAEPTETGDAVEADHRLSTMTFKRAAFIGAGQILALLPGISRDGIVTVFGMGRGLNREDAVRFSFLLSAPVILAAGVLKLKDLFGPLGNGIHGPVLVGSVLSFIGAYVSVRFLTRYFSESKSLNPFGIYCIVAGILSLVYLTIR